MRISTKQMLRVLYVLSWVIFIGVSVDAGAFLFGVGFTVFMDPVTAQKTWREINLSGLYQHDHGHFYALAAMIGIVLIFKALLFYLILKLLHEKKLNMSQPFNQDTGRFIFAISYLTLVIGLFSQYGIKYAAWLTSKQVEMPEVQTLRLGGADVWFFMSVTLFVIAHIFKRGIEMQNENDLTI